MRELLAIWMGRVAGSLSRRLGRGGGTTVPGRIARRIAPQILTQLTNRLPHGVIVVAGTNGKTTTTRMIASLLQASGWRLLHNRSGANLVTGVTTTVIDGVRWSGALPYDAALFECDEAALPQIIREAQPRVVVLHNLFRDQLDRYGEVDTIADNWKTALSALPAHTIVLINGDDPSLARLGADLHCTVIPLRQRRYCECPWLGRTSRGCWILPMRCRVRLHRPVFWAYWALSLHGVWVCTSTARVCIEKRRARRPARERVDAPYADTGGRRAVANAGTVQRNERARRCGNHRCAGAYP